MTQFTNKTFIFYPNNIATLRQAFIAKAQSKQGKLPRNDTLGRVGKWELAK